MVVLDASALLAFLLDEAGATVVDEQLSEAVISTVNWAEVLQRLQRHGADTKGVQEDLQALGLDFIPFEIDNAAFTASLWEKGRKQGLSLGDRACLALGVRLNCFVLTADRVWPLVFPDLPIQVIR
ncbi:MAG: type II toxin-antitoxin system VapC family toxin [Prochlorothrix sp.]